MFVKISAVLVISAKAITHIKARLWWGGYKQEV